MEGRQALVIVLVALAAGSHVLVQSSKHVTNESVWVVVGTRADLPCQPNPKDPDDTPMLVLWYRTSNSEPIYSYDARGSSFATGERWYDKKILGIRAYFVAASFPPRLSLEPVLAYDQGVFTCRIDYRISPSTTVLVNLTVVVPPGPPMVLWEGQSVVGSVGPLGLGERTKLTCRSSGGRPAPTLSWYKKNGLLPITSAKTNLDPVSGVYTSEATISILATRELQGAALTCHAATPKQPDGQDTTTTTTLPPPRMASVFLNITLPPVEVRILASGTAAAAGTTLRLVCRSSGSHPPARLIWRRSHSHLLQVTHSIEDGGNITSATLTILVNRHHDGVQLSCTGVNPDLPHATLTDTTILSVYYPPVVGLSLGASMKEDFIEEGHDVYFECSIEANPPFHRVDWHHNGKELQHNMSAGVVMNGVDLVMRQLLRKDSGSYTCTAANIEGRTTSNAVHLAVRHVPFCAGGGQERTQGSARGSTVAVKCRVEAQPAHDITWTWIRKKIDGSEEELPQENIRNNGVSSSVLVTPHTPEDYGRFLCLATNSVGRQAVACVVNLVPAGPPDTPTNCSVTQGKPTAHLDSVSLSITCLEGFDGGLPQKFQIEARQDGNLISNMTSEFPEWVVAGLKAGVTVTLRVTAHNARGKSESLSLEVHTTSAQHRAAPDAKSVVTIPPIVGAALGLVAVVLLVIVVALIICKRMRPRPQKPRGAEIPLAPTTGGDNFDPDVVTSIQRPPPSIDVLPLNQDGDLDDDDDDDSYSYDHEHLHAQHSEDSHTHRQSYVYVHRPRDAQHSPECVEGQGGLCSCDHRQGSRLVHRGIHQASREDNLDTEDVAINDSQSNDSGMSESESESELRELVPGGQVGAIIRQYPDSGRAYVTLSSGQTLEVPPEAQLRLVSSDYAGPTTRFLIERESKEPSPVEVRLKPFVSKEYKLSPDAVEELRFMPSSCRELKLVPTTAGGETGSTISSIADVRSPSSRDLPSGISSCVSSRPPSSCAVMSPSSQREVICLPISPGESPRSHLASRHKSRESSREASNPTTAGRTSKQTRPILTTKELHSIPTSGQHVAQDQGELGRSVTLLQDEHGEILFIPKRTSTSEGVKEGKHSSPVFPGVKVSDSSRGQTPPPFHPVTLPKAVARQKKKSKEKEKIANDSNRILPSTGLVSQKSKPVISVAGKRSYHHTRPHSDTCRRESSV